MINENEDLTPGEARDALESAAKMEGAGWRRAVPERRFGAGMAMLIGSLFAIYALEDPYPYIVFPDVKANKWVLVLFAAVLLVVFFGSIVIRRTYDAAWVSVVAGMLVGLIVFRASERERRAYLAKAGGGQE